MKPKLYDFDKRLGILDQKFYVVTDYFQYYTTGVEDVVRVNQDIFGVTSRDNAERPEVIAHNLYQDADFADVLVGANNENLLWGSPFDLDSFQDAIEFKMNYLEYLMPDRIFRTYDNDSDVFDKQYEFNDVGKIVYERVKESIEYTDTLSRKFVVIDPTYSQEAFRKMRDYFEFREVK